MSLDKETVKNIALLARIGVKEEELDGMVSELNGIVDWVNQLSQINTDGVEPLASVSNVTLRQRDDVITDGGIAEDIVANAPQKEENFFMVPKVVE